LVVVLVEPAGPRNVGSIARLCANFEVRELRLVAPRCDHRGEEARQMAVHGAAVLEQARLFPSLAAALADCRRVVASSGRRNGEPLPLHDPASALDWLIGAAAPSPAPDQNPAPAPTSAPVALVFGREDRGLSNAELLQAGRLLCIDTGASYGSLNLAQAAAIVLHQWQQRRQAQPRHAAASSTEPGPEPSTRGPLEAMLSDAEALLLEVGFLYPHTAAARMAKLRALLQRAQAGSEEVALLRGMVRQLRWASRHQPSTEPRADPGQTP
jgi:tRNA/rRNA methyltransferase